MQKARALPEPPSEYLRLVFEVALLLLDAAGQLKQNFASLAAEFDLPAPQMKVLLVLDAGEPVPMRVLAGRLHYDSSNLTGLVDRLEARGAISRQPDPGDRRVKAVAITDEGVSLRDAFWHRSIGSAGALKALDERQLVKLRDLLRAALLKD